MQKLPQTSAYAGLGFSEDEAEPEPGPSGSSEAEWSDNWRYSSHGQDGHQSGSGGSSKLEASADEAESEAMLPSDLFDEAETCASASETTFGDKKSKLNVARQQQAFGGDFQALAAAAGHRGLNSKPRSVQQRQMDVQQKAWMAQVAAMQQYAWENGGYCDYSRGCNQEASWHEQTASSKKGWEAQYCVCCGQPRVQAQQRFCTSCGSEAFEIW